MTTELERQATEATPLAADDLLDEIRALVKQMGYSGQYCGSKRHHHVDPE